MIGHRSIEKFILFLFLVTMEIRILSISNFTEIITKLRSLERLMFVFSAVKRLNLVVYAMNVEKLIRNMRKV